MMTVAAVREAIDCEIAWAGRVPWGWRVRLWLAMDREFPDTSIARRNALAYRVAAASLPAYDRVRDRVLPRHRDTPERVLAFARSIIVGEVGQDARFPWHYQDEVESCLSYWDELGPDSQCPLLCDAVHDHASGRQDAVIDDHFLDGVWDADFVAQLPDWEDELIGSEAHTWGSAVAGGFADMPGYDPERVRRYWERWAADLLPAACAPGLTEDEALATMDLPWDFFRSRG